MAIKAEWHFGIEAPKAEEYDPLSDASYMAPIPPIDVTTPEPELHEHLRDLIRQEGALYNEGITCPIKWDSEVTCLACPVSEEKDPESPKGKLCRVGHEEERVLTVLKAQKSELTP